MTSYQLLRTQPCLSYSTLLRNPNLPPPLVAGPANVRIVPILPYRHSSKWNSTGGRRRDQFVVTFDKRGMPEGYGVKYVDLASYSPMVMKTAIVRGCDIVRFPTPGKKIQLRIVWPGYHTVDFSSMIDVQEITVGELAVRVAFLYRDYFQAVCQRLSTEDGWSCTGEMLDTLHFVCIRNFYDNVYQAGVVLG
ncbi:hypothetical protein BJ322DRAFT_358465 [Thelephora terrestris]|uniref:Uncharacterized protein n=1 Tax=Thelephora terrestris TaxID=56493 RepID=A0A9P6H7V7_9AGAM|nr:hypothetical protein BJ322DRAFT_358465 [Thelephora terrestris]